MSLPFASRAIGSTITSATANQPYSNDAQNELLASLGIGSDSILEGQSLSVASAPGLEAYAQFFPLTIFSGYLNTWVTPSTPEQTLLSNLLSGSGLPTVGNGNGDQTEALLNQIFSSSSNNEHEYSASVIQTTGLQTTNGIQPTVTITSQGAATLAAPEPGTLVLFGCATVALSLALANRTSKGLSGDLSSLPDVTDTTRLPPEKI